MTQENREDSASRGDFLSSDVLEITMEVAEWCDVFEVPYISAIVYTRTGQGTHKRTCWPLQ